MLRIDYPRAERDGLNRRSVCFVQETYGIAYCCTLSVIIKAILLLSDRTERRAGRLRQRRLPVNQMPRTQEIE